MSEKNKVLSKRTLEASEMKSAIGDWIKNTHEKPGTKYQAFIVSTTIFKQRKRLLIMLPKLRNRLKADDPAKLLLDDGILLLRRDFGDCFRHAFSMSNDTEIDLTKKFNLVKQLYNLSLEIEDYIKEVVIAGKDQISLTDIMEIIFTFGEMCDSIDRWANSLKNK